MKHRIAAGVLVEEGGRVLLVRHKKPGVYDFWVAPGGGAENTEDLRATVRREVREECGLEVEPVAIAYIEEFWNPHMRECKIWFTGRIVGGELRASTPEAEKEHIVDAAFMSPDEFEGKIIFPAVLYREYWKDKALGFSSPRYLGLRKMEFY